MISRRSFLGITGAACAGAFINKHAEASKRPNVIVIMADDMGVDTLSAFGGTAYNNPEFDRITKKGMRFTHAYSQPLCTPSRLKIMTGRSNARNYERFGHMNPNEVTFGHIMKNAGYKTCIAGKWQLCGGNAHDGSFPNESGFDEALMWAYDHDLPENVRDKYTFFGGKTKKTSRFWNPAIVHNGNYVPTTEEDYGPDIYCRFILDFIEKNKDEEFFVYYPMALTHSPFLATPLSEDQSVKAKTKSQDHFFADMVRYTGVIVERILHKLESAGIAEDTLVVFTTDNGTNRRICVWMGDRPVPGGKGIPIEAGVHAPMLAWWKGVIEPGSVCTDLIEHSDYLPTLAELGQAKLPDCTIDGRSFFPQIKGKKGNPRDTVTVHYDKSPDEGKPSRNCVRFAYDGQYKLYQNGRFYNIPDDWTESNPIQENDMTGPMQEANIRLQKALSKLPVWMPDPEKYEGQEQSIQEYRDKVANMIRRKQADRTK